MKLASLMVVFAFGCDSTEFLTAEQADLVRDQLLMSATLTHELRAEVCPVARRLELRSYEGRLQISTHLVKNPTCGSEPEMLDARSYTVTAVEYEEGSKLYTASSASGTLWLMDDRPLGTEIPWTVEMVDYESPPDIDPVVTMQAFAVQDLNLRFSGNTVYPIRVVFDQPTEPDVFASLVYSLALVPESSGPLDPSNPLVYEIQVMSDLGAAHVLSQLQAISHVRSVTLL